MAEAQRSYGMYISLKRLTEFLEILFIALLVVFSDPTEDSIQLGGFIAIVGLIWITIYRRRLRSEKGSIVFSHMSTPEWLGRVAIYTGFAVASANLVVASITILFIGTLYCGLIIFQHILKARINRWRGSFPNVPLIIPGFRPIYETVEFDSTEVKNSQQKSGKDREGYSSNQIDPFKVTTFAHFFVTVFGVLAFELFLTQSWLDLRIRIWLALGIFVFGLAMLVYRFSGVLRLK